MKKIPVRHIRATQKNKLAPGNFSIRRVEDIADGKELLHDLHRHDFFFLLALQAGGGTHDIDFMSYEVHDHSIFILRPGQVHQLTLHAGCIGYLLEFDTGFYHPGEKTLLQRLQRASHKNYCRPETVRFEKLFAALHYIFEEYTHQQTGYDDIIRANLDIFFTEFVRQSANPASVVSPANSHVQERFEEFIMLLEKHITNDKQASQYTGRMHLSAYQLNEITKASIGKTASEVINEHIILEAKRYLLATSLQIKEVAGHLGYEDISYFIRFFKKHTGFSPEAFRQQLR